MDELDRKIAEALSAEDRELLGRFGDQGMFAQWFGVYQGPFRWMATGATVMTFLLVIAAVYCGWRLFGTTAVIDAVRWGTGVVVLIVAVGFLKIWFWLRMESNRVLREVKRIELQIARANGR
jgi:hypothetical protein